MKRLPAILIAIAVAFSTLNVGAAKAAKNGALWQRGNAAIKFVNGRVNEANRRLRYTIKARYPQAVGSDARMVKLNQAIKSLALKEVAGFKKDFSVPEERGPSGSYFDLSYSIELATDKLVSLTFYEDSFYEGAAHPNHGSLTLNYDLDSGRVLKLADLFKPNSHYLMPISNYAINSLKKQLAQDPDLDWLKKGAGPEEENYKSWAITRRGLKVTFDPYQVASYAEGPHEVVIPFSLLRNVIEPNGPVSGM
jgi:hypothetical protein